MEKESVKILGKNSFRENQKWSWIYFYSSPAITLQTIHPNISLIDAWYGSGQETAAVLLPGFAISW